MTSFIHFFCSISVSLVMSTTDPGILLRRGGEGWSVGDTDREREREGKKKEPRKRMQDCRNREI